MTPTEEIMSIVVREGFPGVSGAGVHTGSGISDKTPVSETVSAEEDSSEKVSAEASADAAAPFSMIV